MRPILSEILIFRQHLNALEQTACLYRPAHCLFCHETVIWRHGVYYRKPDRLNSKEDSMNDIQIPRYQCAACRHTFSTLPECIAPARWYPWVNWLADSFTNHHQVLCTDIVLRFQ